jgi:hypothetical protein
MYKCGLIVSLPKVSLTIYAGIILIMLKMCNALRRE